MSKVGDKIIVHINSRDGQNRPIVFERKATIIEKKGRWWIRLDNGLEAPYDAAEIVERGAQ
jgi:hypothetical protein